MEGDARHRRILSLCQREAEDSRTFSRILMKHLEEIAEPKRSNVPVGSPFLTSKYCCIIGVWRSEGMRVKS